MNRRFPLSDVIASLYSAFFNRSPQQAETDFYDQAITDRTLTEIIAGIVESEEFLQCRYEALVASLTVPSATSIARSHHMTIAADDVMGVIANAYERLLGRDPSFAEVAKRFKSIVNGSTLQGEIASIAESVEARLYRSALPVSSASPVPAAISREIFGDYMTRVYTLCFKRSIVPEEVDIWYRHHLDGVSLAEILRSITDSDEAKGLGRGLEAWEPGKFVQLLYEIILGRGAAPREIEHYRLAITTGNTSRASVLASLFEHVARQTTEGAPPDSNDHTKALLFGHRDLLTTALWKKREDELVEAPAAPQTRGTRFHFTSKASPLVSIITSLYRGGVFIESFLENITSQTIFADHCELLIVDANSPEGELEKAEPFLKRFPNIRYRRHTSRIGIYEAWNLCIQDARGEYCTNANLDDCRRNDSLELQASTLDALPFVDVVYQNVLYSYGENMPFPEIESFGFATDMPIISRYNLLEFNSPHNGPMWRKSLHDEIGLFNADYKSAADFDFWTRCVAAGKTFYKINDPHVAYYVNPEGLSTRSDTRGAAESNRITKSINRRLIGEHLLMSDAAYAKSLETLAHGPVETAGRHAMAQAALRKISAASRDDARARPAAARS